MRNAKKILSTICALSMVASSAQSITALAADIDYSIGKIEINGVVLGEGTAMSVESIKAEIVSLGEVNFENYASKKDAVIRIVESINRLSDTEKQELLVEMNDDPNVASDTYWKAIKDASLIVEAGPVYEMFKSDIPADGVITTENYKNYYVKLKDIEEAFGNLSADSQKKLSDTEYLYRWQAELDKVVNNSNGEIADCISALEAVVTDSSQITAQTYKTCFDNYVKAKNAHTALLQVQQEELDVLLAEAGEMSAQEILTKGQDALAEFKDNMIESIKELVSAEEITFENCTEIKENAENAATLYATLINLDNSYTDAALSEKIENYAAVADYFITASAIQSEDFIIANYVAKGEAIDTLLTLYNGLSSEQKTLAVGAKSHVDGLVSAWNTFKSNLVNTAISAIDAIGDFDHDTWKNREQWAEVGTKLAAAKAAINNVGTKFESEITNLSDYNDKATEYAQINSDYNEANQYIVLVDRLGTVGDVTSDNITLNSGEDIEAAERAYAALSLVQQGLVADEYSKMVSARNEYDQLKAQETLVKNLLNSFNDEYSSLNFGYMTCESDMTGDDIKAAVKAVTDYYDEAYAQANDTAFGTKLKSLVDADTTAKNEKLIEKSAKLIELKQKCAALNTAGEELFAILGVTLNGSEDINEIIENFAANNPTKVDALAEAVTKAEAAVADFEVAKTACESVMGNMPDSGIYATIKKVEKKCKEISERYNVVNPVEAVAKVDEWAANVENLFNNIEEKCAEGLAEDEYDNLKDTLDNFENAEINYCNKVHAIARSRMIYIERRIAEYRQASEYEENVNAVIAQYEEFIEKYDAMPAYDDDYLTASSNLISNIESYNDMYAVMEKPIKDLVENRQTELENIKKELKEREQAYYFDKSVELLKKHADNGMTKDTYAEEQEEWYSRCWAQYNSNSSAVKEYIKELGLLKELEAKLVMQAINAVAEDNFDAALADANTCYEVSKTHEGVSELVTNKAKLDEYNKVKVFRDAVNTFIETVENTDEKDIANCLTEKNRLYEEYEAIEPVEELSSKICDAAYTALMSAHTNIISTLCKNIEVDKIETMSETELEDVKAQLDLIGVEYAKLTIEQKMNVKNYAKYEEGKKAYEKAKLAYDTNHAAAVDALIAAIGYIVDGNVTMNKDNYGSYKNAIDTAKTAYEALTEEQKNLVSDANILTDAENDYNAWVAAEAEAKPVKDMIAALEEDIDKDNYKDVREACDALDEAEDALSVRAKLFITADEITKKNKVKDKLSDVEAYMSVIDAIREKILGTMYNDIVNNAAINIEYAQIISDIEAQYNRLSVEQKTKVDNYAALHEARVAYDKNVSDVISYIQNSIDAIDIDNLVKDTATDEMFKKTEDLINSLSEENKEKIGSSDDTAYATRLLKFKAAKEKYDSIKTPDDVMDMIDDLGNPQNLTEENFADSKKAVEDVWAAYESLASSEKEKVENFAKLREWKNAIDNFNIDHSGDVTLDGKVDIDDIYEMVQYVLGRKTPGDEEFNRANIVKATDGAAEEIDIYDILAAIDLIEF